VLLDLHECMHAGVLRGEVRPRRRPPCRQAHLAHRAGAIRFADCAVTCTDRCVTLSFREERPTQGGAYRQLPRTSHSSIRGDTRRPVEAPPSSGSSATARSRRSTASTRSCARSGLLSEELPGLRLESTAKAQRCRRYGPWSQIFDLVVGELAGRFVPIEELIQAIANADAGVVAIRRDLHRDLTHCNKMFDFIAMQKPAIVSGRGRSSLLRRRASRCSPMAMSTTSRGPSARSLSIPD